MINIFKASAGSGKTYRLTLEYLKYLFAGADNYRHILAVTFTNKATDEMKERIIKTLYLLAFAADQKSALKSEDIVKELLASLSLEDNPKNREYISATALRNLKAILHDYSSFSVSTIDKFFQNTIRNFAREIGRNTAYNVEIDNDSVISQAVDNMLSNLGNKENEGLLNWLIGYSVDQIENGSYWDIKNNLKSIAGQLKKEDYKIVKSRYPEERVTKEQVTNYMTALRQIVSSFEKKLRAIGSEAIALKDSMGFLWSDFKSGAGRFGKFEKYTQGIYDPSIALFNSFDNFDEWVTKDAQKKSKERYEIVLKAYTGGLNKLVGQVKELAEEGACDYLTAGQILKNIYHLGILSDIENFAKDFAAENNLMLLSDSNELLNKIIDGSDTPFIYEKIGTRIDHFMLDEFQDTSALQWENFKSLIGNSVAAGYDNLIVGDIKQSIYRWRGSDWELLNSKINEDAGEVNIKETTLLDNYRSARAIVEFNNNFFSFAADKTDGEFSTLSQKPSTLVTEIYKDAKQNLPENIVPREGHLRIELFDNIETETGKKSWKRGALEKIPETIDNLLEKGYSYRDITILVRANDEGSDVINYLLNHEKKYPVMSGESLIISESSTIKLLIPVLRYINNPQNLINLEILKRSGIEPDLTELGQLQLFELCEQIVFRYFNWVKSEAVYIYSFLDLVSDYIKKGKADLSSFLTWWDESGVKKSISSPPDQDAINVMTIHKSKGLGIKAVIVPFIEWKLKTDHSKLLWVRPQTPPFNMIKNVPVLCEKSSLDTHFREEFLNETLRSYVDVLNIAYVAFTRASHELIIFAKKRAEKSSSGCAISDLIQDFMKLNNIAGNVYETGTSTEQVTSKSDTTPGELTIPDIKIYLPGDRIKIKLKSEAYYNNEARKYGIIMHEILSRIESENDVESAVDEEISQGRISLKSKDELFSKLKQMLSSVEKYGWFSGDYIVKNEAEIIVPGGEIYRPDRILLQNDNSGKAVKAIVIDFKFGSIQKNSYITQINSYIELLKKMGIANVEGFIWYIEENHITPAKNSSI